MSVLFLNVQCLPHFMAPHDWFLFPWLVLHVWVSSCLADSRVLTSSQIYQDNSEKACLPLSHPHPSFPSPNPAVPTVLKWSDLLTSEPGPSELLNIKLTSTGILSNCNMCLGKIAVTSYVAGADTKVSMKKTIFWLCFSFAVQGLEFIL